MTHTVPNYHTVTRSWAPMIAIALAQVLMSFNVASLPVALSGMVKSFNVPPTEIATGIVVYSLFVAAFVMAGAKLCLRYGPVKIFRTTVVVFGIRCSGLGSRRGWCRRVLDWRDFWHLDWLAPGLCRDDFVIIHHLLA